MKAYTIVAIVSSPSVTSGLSAVGERVSFQSSGLSIAGLFFATGSSRPSPAVVLCQGTIGVKEHYRFPELAAAFAAAGIATLIFDYRGLGESDGVLRTGASDFPKTEEQTA